MPNALKPVPDVSAADESRSTPRVKRGTTYRLTKTGKLFFGLAALFYVASLTSQSGLLLLLVGVLLGCYILNLIAARRSVQHLEIEPPKNMLVSEGERAAQPWRIRNAGPRRAGLVAVEAHSGPVVKHPAIEPGQQVTCIPSAVFDKRGVVSFSELRLTSLHPFGFIKVSRRLDVRGEIVVHPRVYHAPVPRAASFDAMVGGKLKGNRRTSSGGIFAGVRPMRPADPLKHIHWKSSAKGQGLMVKTFDEELSGRVALVVDSSTADPALLDDCARAAASLAFAALEAGHHVELVDVASSRAVHVPPFADGAELLDALARIASAPGSLNGPNLDAAIASVSARAALCFVFTEFNKAARETLDRARSRGRVVSLYLPEKFGIAGDYAGVPLGVYSSSEIVEQRSIPVVAAGTRAQPAIA